MLPNSSLKFVFLFPQVTFFIIYVAFVLLYGVRTYSRSKCRPMGTWALEGGGGEEEEEEEDGARAHESAFDPKGKEAQASKRDSSFAGAADDDGKKEKSLLPSLERF